MSLFEEKQPLAGEKVGGAGALLLSFLPRGNGEQEFVLKQGKRFEVRLGHGKRDQDDVELAAQQFSQQRVRHRLAQLQRKLRETLLELR